MYFRQIQSIQSDTKIVNTYRDNAPRFVDGEVIPSQEGTSQGDPWPCVSTVSIIKNVALIENCQRTVNPLSVNDE